VHRFLLAFLVSFLCASAADTGPATGLPVLVELFTSEGCSSCPPADALLQRLDAAQAPSGSQIIVLSEHVDYWDHDGWVDPHSSRIFTDRQNAYAMRFGLASPYTPEMVVDGQSEFVGSNVAKANAAIEKARMQPKVAVKISGVSLENGVLRAHVEAGNLPDGLGKHKADIYLVLAIDHAESQVQRGENQGRHLTHVGVVTSLRKIGTLEKAKVFAQDISTKIERGKSAAGSVRVIVFLQEAAEGRIVGATQQSLSIVRTTRGGS
jgi:hypothetical protein